MVRGKCVVNRKTNYNLKLGWTFILVHLSPERYKVSCRLNVSTRSLPFGLLVTGKQRQFNAFPAMKRFQACTVVWADTASEWPLSQGRVVASSCKHKHFHLLCRLKFFMQAVTNNRAFYKSRSYSCCPRSEPSVVQTSFSCRYFSRHLVFQWRSSFSASSWK